MKTYAQANGGSYSWTLDDDFGDDEDSEDDYEDHLYSVPDPPKPKAPPFTAASPSHDGDSNVNFSDSSLDSDSEDELSYFSHIRHVDFPSTTKRQSPITTPEESDNANMSDSRSDFDSDEEVPVNFSLVTRGFRHIQSNKKFPSRNEQADKYETKQESDRQKERVDRQSRTNSATSNWDDNSPNFDSNSLVEGENEAEDDYPPYIPNSHFVSSSAPAMETGFEEEEENSGHSTITIPRRGFSNNFLSTPYSSLLETIEEGDNNSPEPTISEDNKRAEPTAPEAKKRGIFDFNWADDEEEEEEVDEYHHIYSYDGPPKPYDGRANSDNSAATLSNSAIFNNTLDNITNLVDDDEAENTDITELHHPSTMDKFIAAVSEADAVASLANNLIAELTAMNEAMTLLRQERFAEVKYQLKQDSFSGRSPNSCAWGLHPIALRPESLAGPYDNYPVPFLCVTDPEGQTYDLVERLWGMTQKQLDDFVERDERHRHMQPFVLQHRDEDETYEQYERALSARRYWAKCMEQDELDKFWAEAHERARQSEMEKMRNAQEEDGSYLEDRDANGNASNKADASGSCDNNKDNNIEFGGSEPEMCSGQSARTGRNTSDPEIYAQYGGWLFRDDSGFVLNEGYFDRANECAIDSEDEEDASSEDMAPPPTPQFAFSCVSKTTRVLESLETVKVKHHATQLEAEQNDADQILFNAKLGWIWSIRHVVSLLINIDRDSLSAKDVRFFDPLRKYIPSLKPPVFINLKMLSNWLRDGRPIQGRSNEDLFDDFYEMIVDYGPERRAINTFLELCSQSSLEFANSERDAQIEKEGLLIWEEEIAERMEKDGKLRVWDMGRECFSVVVRDNKGERMPL